MMSKKKQNLLLPEFKHKFVNKKIKTVVLGYTIVVICVGGIFSIQSRGIKNDLDTLYEKTNAYKTTENNVKTMENSIKDKQTELSSLNETFFPFANFIDFLYNSKPTSVAIISIETDTIVKEAEEKAIEEEKQKQLAEEGLLWEAEVVEEITEESSDVETGSDTSGQFLTTIDTETFGEDVLIGDDGEKLTDEEIEKKKAEIIERIEKNKEYTTLKYESDLKGNSVRVRGYSESIDEVSRYITAIKQGKSADYISSIVINGIEEKTLGNGEVVTLFELLIHLKDGGASNVID